mmetsp:Transcript_34661/g.96792  ORF Transcript_34661/g.96792 Transcript_34661/m.96792 type:complete len:135 (-) Transcript_34661:201-605(-)
MLALQGDPNGAATHLLRSAALVAALAPACASVDAAAETSAKPSATFHAVLQASATSLQSASAMDLVGGVNGDPPCMEQVPSAAARQPTKATRNNERPCQRTATPTATRLPWRTHLPRAAAPRHVASAKKATARS